MPTVISHAAVAVAASFGLGSSRGFVKLVFLSIICAVIPDADMIGYHLFYIPYTSFLGHRGFSHSICFAALFSALIVFAFYRSDSISSWMKYFLFFFILTASHGILDAFTNGGHGIALLSPFTDYRYVFPFTPIEVSPFSPRAFLGQRGLIILKSELLWTWMPSLFAAVLLKLVINRKLKNRP